MSRLTLAEATAQVEAWKAASLALATAKSYTIGNRQLTRSDTAEIRDMITYWEGQCQALEAQARGAKNPGVRIATWS